MRGMFICVCLAVFASGALFGAAKTESANSSETRVQKYLPAIPNTKPVPFDRKNLPTGAKDFDIEKPRQTGGCVVNAADFGLNENAENCAEIINAAIARCKKVGASKLILPKGIYKVYDNLSVSFDGLKDFVFDGGGSTLIYCQRSRRNMEIKNCERVEFRNFNFDWDWTRDPLGSLVEVTDKNADPKGGWIDFKFFEYEKFPRRDMRIAYLSRWDKETKSVGVEDGYGIAYEMHLHKHEPAKYEWLDDNTVRVKSKAHQLARANVGDIFRLQHSYYEVGGIGIDSNANMLMENVNIYSCSGQAITVFGTQTRWAMRNVNIDIPEGVARRPLSSTADHLIFAQSAGFFKMENCSFGYGCDDCINFHDNSLYVVKSGENCARTVQNRNIRLFPEGDLVDLRFEDYSPAAEALKITSQKLIDKKRGVYELTFSSKIAGEIGTGFVLFNKKFGTRNIIVRNCRFHHNRARGILILCKDVTIENCRFERNEMGAIKIETGFTRSSWCEGYGVDNVVIKNNEFENSNPLGVKNGGNGGMERDVYAGIYLRRDPSNDTTDYPIISKVLFEGNVFKNSFGLVAYLKSVQNFTFLNNIFINEIPRKNPQTYRGAFYATHCKNISFINNVWVKSPLAPEPGLILDGDTNSGITFEGNTVADTPPASALK